MCYIWLKLSHSQAQNVLLRGTLELGSRGSNAGLPLSRWVISCKMVTLSAFTWLQSKASNHLLQALMKITCAFASAQRSASAEEALADTLEVTSYGVLHQGPSSCKVLPMQNLIQSSK